MRKPLAHCVDVNARQARRAGRDRKNKSMSTLELVLVNYRPLVEAKKPGKSDVACAIVTKHWDDEAEKLGYRGLDGKKCDINQNNVLLVLKTLAIRKPEFAAELKAAR